MRTYLTFIRSNQIWLLIHRDFFFFSCVFHFAFGSNRSTFIYGHSLSWQFTMRHRHVLVREVYLSQINSNRYWHMVHWSRWHPWCSVTLAFVECIVIPMCVRCGSIRWHRRPLVRTLNMLSDLYQTKCSVVQLRPIQNQHAEQSFWIWMGIKFIWNYVQVQMWQQQKGN